MLGWRVGRDELRELRFDRLELADQSIEFGVGDGWLVVDEVPPVVLLDLLAQLCGSHFDLGRYCHALKAIGGV